MNAGTRITGRLIAAARSLVGNSQADLASACGISVETLNRMESSDSAWFHSNSERSAVMA